MEEYLEEVIEFALTPVQQQIFELAETTHQNMFIGGDPGTGKSVLTRALLTRGQKPYQVGAPTGLAALNAMGKTLHSMISIPIVEGAIPPDYGTFEFKGRVEEFLKYGLKYLIIDEVSMLRADVFDYIDRALRSVKGIPKPFGGVQVIIVGDFFQLPPVTNSLALKELKEYGYRSPFVFDSFVWNEADFKFFHLTEVLRQKGDKKFMEILRRARDGRTNDSDVKIVNKQVGKIDGLRLTLTATNQESDRINFGRLKALPGDECIFLGDRFGDWPQLPIEERVVFKMGAQVMVKKNSADRPPRSKGAFESQVVNGTLGKVVGWFDGNVDDIPAEVLEAAGQTDQNPHVTIELENGNHVKIYRATWQKKIKEKDSEGKWIERVVASYTQIPLTLAWSISMHKSQGQTFEKVHIDPKRIFAAGQLYVAMSRCRTLAGISLERPIKKAQFWANSRVLKFYDQLES